MLRALAKESRNVRIFNPLLKEIIVNQVSPREQQLSGGLYSASSGDKCEFACDGWE